MGTLNKLHKESLRERRVEGIKKAATEEWEQKAIEDFFTKIPPVSAENKTELINVIQGGGGYIPWSIGMISDLLKTVASLRLAREERDRVISKLSRDLVNFKVSMTSKICTLAFAFANNVLLCDSHNEPRYKSLSPEGWLSVWSMTARTDCVQALLDTGVDVNTFAKIGTGLLPLSGAALAGSIEVMQLLLDSGAKLNAKRGDMTALTWAAWGGRLESAELLLDRGAYHNVNYSYVSALTPLKIAETMKAWDVVKLLKGRKAKGKLSLETKRILRAMK